MRGRGGRIRVLAVLAVLLCAGSASRAETAAVVSEAANHVSLEAALSAPASDLGSKVNGPLLQAFYARRGFEPVWTGGAAARDRAALALATLAAARDQGLEPADYHIGTAPLAGGAAQSVTYELLLTDGLLHYMKDLAVGRVPTRLDDSDRALPARAFDPVSVLFDALAGDRLADILAQLPPPFTGYRRLAAALAQYREIEKEGGWLPVPSTEGEVLLDGSDARAAALWQRLAPESPDLIRKAKDPDMDRLKEAVRRYQARNGLVVDGRAGARTLAALNIAMSERILQIGANMERWRWLPRELEPRYVFVQLPDGILRYIANGKVILDSRVIFGRARDPSPVLRTQAVAVTVNPPWTVPHTIAVQEILPELRKEPGYLMRHNMVLLNGPPGDPYGMTIDWKNLPASAFRYRVQQLPGETNALGRIKLEMPNRFTVYLHDTPVRMLFAQPNRALSHGCIRVEQILPLASLALTGDQDAAQAMLTEAIATSETKRFNLAAPLPVYILYWTAIADDRAVVGFRPDLYKRDARLIEEIEKRRASWSRLTLGNKSGVLAPNP